MIVAVVALIFWALSPTLGVVVALTLPSVLAADTDGSYSGAYLVVMLALALFFFRRVSGSADKE